MTKQLIKIVSFNTIDKHSDWEPELHTKYFCSHDRPRKYFTDTFENDDGEEEEEEVKMTCLEIYSTIEDLINGDDCTYIPIDYSDYSVISMSIDLNDNNEINLIGKQERSNL